MSLHRHDQHERKKLTWWILGAILALLLVWLGLRWFRSRLAEVAANDVEAGVGMAFGMQSGVAVLLAAQFFFVAWYVLKRARQVITLARFPLPGSKTVGTFRVREGIEAKRLGYAGVLLGIGFTIAGCIALWFARAMAGD
jgi:hypothetical protein